MIRGYSANKIKSLVKTSCFLVSPLILCRRYTLSTLSTLNVHSVSRGNSFNVPKLKYSAYLVLSF